MSNNPMCNITAGFIMSELVLWESKLAETINEDCPRDWLMGGFWLLSEAVATAIQSAPLKWEDGVFEYEHCSADGDSLWMPVVKNMTGIEWYELCGNNVVPDWVGHLVGSKMVEFGVCDDA